MQVDERLRAATIAPAQFLGLESTLGSLRAGKIADIVLLDADPLADIRNTRRIFAVVRGGRVLERGDLDRLLATARNSAP